MRAARPIPRPPSCAARHLGFIARLGRGRRIAEAVPPLGLVLRRMARAVVQRSFGAMHFTLRVLARANATEPVRLDEQPIQATAAAVRDGVLVLRERIATHHDGQRHVLRERHVRIATAPPPVRVQSVRQFAQARAGRATRVEIAHAGPPTSARVLVHGAARVARTTPAHDAPPIPHATSHREARAAWPIPPIVPTGLAPHELSRVTEHVIERLDQRARSWRERNGRP